MVEFDPVRSSQRGLSEGDMVALAAVGLMTVGVVHDFGNLLQVVSSSIHLIEQKLDRRALVEVEPFIREALQSVDKAAGLSRTILDVSAAESEFEEAVRLDSVLLAMKKPVSWTVGSDIRVELDLDRDLPPVFCSAREFERVVLNLAINARDAMPEGGVLRIDARRCEFADGATVVLRLSDSGCGMPPEVAKRAFQPLFTTKPLGRGHGLGLAMVGEFARRAGGSVQLTSAVNCGTSVILRLPACRG